MKIVSRQPSKTLPARIGALSVLPVFLDLRDKRVVVAGGSDAAAWKAELLAAAGARIDLYAADPSEETARLLARENRIAHHAREWDRACLPGAAIALADAEDEGEARAFEAAARAAGVPCNVIDRPAYCHFQFGSIVNRSPVVVGISTSGAAPILGQAIRRRIETLLPPWLAAWARIAMRLRGAVVERISPGAARRAFWEAFVDRAFGAAPDAVSEGDLMGMIGGHPAPGNGQVTFVGAGPGDAELLTIKAVRALQAADVILYDDLVSDAVLELARREAKRVAMGRRAGRPGRGQAETSRMMISLFRSGQRVVCLEAGNPSIIGRTGEVIAELQRNGVALSVIPGVVTGLASAPSPETFPLHRDNAQRCAKWRSNVGHLPGDADRAASRM